MIFMFFIIFKFMLISDKNAQKKIAKDTLKYSKWWNIIKNDDFLSIFHDLSSQFASFQMKYRNKLLIFIIISQFSSENKS